MDDISNNPQEEDQSPPLLLSLVVMHAAIMDNLTPVEQGEINARSASLAEGIYKSNVEPLLALEVPIQDFKNLLRNHLVTNYPATYGEYNKHDQKRAVGFLTSIHIVNMVGRVQLEEENRSNDLVINNCNAAIEVMYGLMSDIFSDL